MRNISFAAPLTAAAALIIFSMTGASAQVNSARGSMEKCVDGVIARMARSKAPETQVGQAVLSTCDGQLRATLASAIKSGEAAICTVESCIGMARDRAAEEAKAAYRERLAR